MTKTALDPIAKLDCNLKEQLKAMLDIVNSE